MREMEQAKKGARKDRRSRNRSQSKSLCTNSKWNVCLKDLKQRLNDVGLNTYKLFVKYLRLIILHFP